jgi:polar amino acid transport system substrate-binding protein
MWNKKLPGWTWGLAAGLVLVAIWGVTGCSGPEVSTDLLEKIQQRGTMIVSTDPNYKPLSYLDINGTRVTGTNCSRDQLTRGEIIGFDVDVAAAIAEQLGVEACFVTPDWYLITAGNWGDGWDISVGSMAITNARQQMLDFVTPYYYTQAQFAAAADAGITTWNDLSGQTVCVSAATTYADWLKGVDLGLPLENIYTDPPVDIQVVEVLTDQECALSAAAGHPEYKIYLTANTVVDSNIEDGLPVVKVGPPVFSENLAPALDKRHSHDITSFIEAVDAAVQALHADGTLLNLSMHWFGVDLTQDPSQ